LLVDRCHRRPQRELAFASKVDGLAKNSQRFLWCMKARRILGFDEIEIEFVLPRKVLGRRELLGGRLRRARLSIPNQCNQRVHRRLRMFCVVSGSPRPILSILIRHCDTSGSMVDVQDGMRTWMITVLSAAFGV
jgi:hypothetical protein